MLGLGLSITKLSSSKLQGDQQALEEINGDYILGDSVDTVNVKGSNSTDITVVSSVVNRSVTINSLGFNYISIVSSEVNITVPSGKLPVLNGYGSVATLTFTSETEASLDGDLQDSDDIYSTLEPILDVDTSVNMFGNAGDGENVYAIMPRKGSELIQLSRLEYDTGGGGDTNTYPHFITVSGWDDELLDLRTLGNAVGGNSGFSLELKQRLQGVYTILYVIDLDSANTNRVLLGEGEGVEDINPSVLLETTGAFFSAPNAGQRLRMRSSGSSTNIVESNTTPDSGNPIASPRGPVAFALVYDGLDSELWINGQVRGARDCPNLDVGTLTMPGNGSASFRRLMVFEGNQSANLPVFFDTLLNKHTNIESYNA